ncbi:hypothetical protein D3C81_1973270 [compost metagenome]
MAQLLQHDADPIILRAGNIEKGYRVGVITQYVASCLVDQRQAEVQVHHLEDVAALCLPAHLVGLASVCEKEVTGLYIGRLPFAA